MNNETISLSSDKIDSEQLIKYKAILKKTNQLRIKFTNNGLLINPRNIDLIWQLSDLISEENILFSYYIEIKANSNTNRNVNNSNDNILKQIIDIKEKGNQIVFSSPEEALVIYNDALAKIDEIEQNNDDNHSNNKPNSNKTKHFNDSITEQKKLLFSNKAFAYSKLKKYNEAIELDLTIIRVLDKLFDKSYARIISNYIELGDLSSANTFAREMKEHFSTYICDKYKSIFDKLDIEENKSNMRLKAITKNSQKNERNTKEKLYTELRLKQTIRRDARRRGLLFNITMFVASGLTLCLLYKYKSNYI